MYFSQRPAQIETAGARIPEQYRIEQKKWDPLYEVYIQRLVPKKTRMRPTRYRAPEYLVRKEERREIKYKDKQRPKRREDSPSSSESSDEENPVKYEDDYYFWNEQVLI